MGGGKNSLTHSWNPTPCPAVAAGAFPPRVVCWPNKKLNRLGKKKEECEGESGFGDIYPGLLFGVFSTPRHGGYLRVLRQDISGYFSTLPHSVGGGLEQPETRRGESQPTFTSASRLPRHSAARVWHSYRVQSGQVGCAAPPRRYSSSASRFPRFLGSFASRFFVFLLLPNP